MKMKLLEQDLLKKKIIICSKILNVNKKFVHINSIEHKFY